MSDESADALKILRDMVRQAERGDVVLTRLRIKNIQPDRWEVGSPSRLRMDNRFTVELEMFARDRGARSQPAPEPVAFEIDPAVMGVMMSAAAPCVVLQSRNNPAYDYRIPAEPFNYLLFRLERALKDKADQNYSVIRVPYEVYRRLMELGFLPRNPTASPVELLGLDLIIEPPGSSAPVFEDGEDESEWMGISDQGYLRGRPTLNDTLRSTKPPLRRPTTTRIKPKEPEKPKTPAGASAAREIIFDD